MANLSCLPESQKVHVNCLLYGLLYASLKLYVLFYMDLGPELQSTARTLAFLKLLTMFNTSFIYYVPDKFLRGSWLKNFLLCT